MAKEKKVRKNIYLEYAEAIVTALLLALVIRAFVVQAFKIPTGSMKPTLLVGDHILVNKFIYGVRIPFTDEKVLPLKKPGRQDIVVFKYPREPERDFIKRIIAVEGDMVEERNKVIYVNGERADMSYARWADPHIRPAVPKCKQPPWQLPRSVQEDCRDNFGPVAVPPGKYFVMGDNRDESYDSRYWGFVDVKAIVGEAMIIYWSWDGARHLPRLGRMASLVQ